MLEILTGSGLATAAGLNAYIPMLVLGLLDRFTSLVDLPTAWQWLSHDVTLWIIAALLVLEVVADKVPVLDGVNDAVQTFIRPSMGGLVFAATSAAEGLDNSTWMTQNPWVGVVLGIVVSGLVHGGKTVARPAINAGTLGFGAPVASSVEDGASVGLSLVAVFIPVLVVLFLVLLAWLLVWLWLKVRRWRKRRDRRTALA
jgi:hypothetical protein